jgi:CRP/FNR family transcriptional regulator
LGLQDFDSIGFEANLPKGAILFRNGDLANSVALLCQGQAKLLSRSREGKVLILRVAIPGDLIGLGAVVSGGRHEFTAEIVEDAVVKSLQKNEFFAFLQRHSQVNVGVAGILSREYKAEFFDDRPLAPAHSAAGRLASIILGFSRGTGHEEPGGSFTMALTHQDLASLAGTSRETVTRVLSSFKRLRLICIRGTSVTVLEPASLIRLATQSSMQS